MTRQRRLAPARLRGPSLALLRVPSLTPLRLPSFVPLRVPALRLPFFALLLTLLAACAGAPPQPAPMARFEREMARAGDYYAEGRLVVAAAAFGRAAAEAERADLLPRLAAAQLGAAACALELGDLAAARRLYAAAAREAAGAGAATDETATAQARALADAAALGLAETLRRGGDPAAAQRDLETLLARRPAPALAVRARLSLALALGAQQRTGEALALLATTDADDTPALRGGWHAARARVRLSGGDAAAALADAERALALDEEARHPPALAAGHALLAEIHQRLGNEAGSAEHLRRAERIFGHTGQQSALAHMRSRLAAAR